MFEKKLLWNVGFSAIDLNGLTEAILESIANRTKTIVAFVNPHSQVVASKDTTFSQALESFDVVLPDGVGVLMASSVTRSGLIERISGPRFFAHLSRDLDDSDVGCKYFFFGSTPTVLTGIVQQMQLRYPNIEVCGTYSPPMREFNDDEKREIIAAINRAKPDVLWVGMTAPKQEKWIANNLESLDIAVAAGIGAEFDYFAGKKKRPAAWIAKSGLQWLHRMVQEPRRTWRRHLISAPYYLASVLWWRIRTPMD